MKLLCLIDVIRRLIDGIALSPENSLHKVAVDALRTGIAGNLMHLFNKDGRQLPPNLTMDQLSIEVIGESENQDFLYSVLQDLIQKEKNSSWFYVAVDTLSKFHGGG